ncbi:MAG: hypothetical protein LBS15_03420 [Endomicrobium sp.]|nr:hypothetical protein [Endomicrobium sp.]
MEINIDDKECKMAVVCGLKCKESFKRYIKSKVWLHRNYGMSPANIYR